MKQMLLGVANIDVGTSFSLVNGVQLVIGSMALVPIGFLTKDKKS